MSEVPLQRARRRRAGARHGLMTCRGRSWPRNLATNVFAVDFPQQESPQRDFCQPLQQPRCSPSCPLGPLDSSSTQYRLTPEIIL